MTWPYLWLDRAKVLADLVVVNAVAEWVVPVLVTVTSCVMKSRSY